MTETLVCLAARHVDSLNLAEGFTSIEPGRFEELVADAPLWLGPRASLETDENYRQLVSYVVFRHGQSIFTYRRTPKGGETRLHGRISIGVGGHVNVSDVVSQEGKIDLVSTLERACSREIAEEIACGAILTLETIGVICESITAVSRVHLGVVVECQLAERDIRLLDPGLVDGRFVPAEELVEVSGQMETWSSALVPHFAQKGRE